MLTRSRAHITLTSPPEFPLPERRRKTKKMSGPATETAGPSSNTGEQQAQQTVQQSLGHALDGLETQAATTSNMVAQVLNRLPDQPALSGGSRHKRKLPSTIVFAGSPSEDVTMYIQRVECLFDLWATPRDDLMDLIPDSLGGHALEWYFRQPASTRRSWEAFKLAISRSFRQSVDMSTLRAELHSRKQLPGETVADYARAILRLCDRCKFEEPMRTTTFMDGLRRDIRVHMRRETPESFDDALLIAS